MDNNPIFTVLGLLGFLILLLLMVRSGSGGG